nr:Por secretion system C-terminal sorting domain [uncultured bacterium]
MQLSSGEYGLAGTSNSPVSGDKTQASQGGSDYWLVKIDQTGSKLWDQRYGGSLAEELGSFIETSEGGFLLGGSSDSNAGGDKKENSRGYSDFWVVKTNAQGTVEWNKTFGGDDTDQAYSIGQAPGGTYFMAGWSFSGKSGDKTQESQGGKDYWLVTLDQQGNKVWDRTFGGSKDDELRASTFTSQGYYVLAGHSYSGKSGDKTQASQGESDYWVVAVDQEGNQVLDQRYGGNGKEELRTVTPTRDGGLLLAGRSASGVSGDRTQSSQGSTDYWLVKVAPLTTSSKIASRAATLTEEPGARTESLNVQAYPNPFPDKVTIRFTLPATQPATVKVVDSQGREVKSLFQGEAQANHTYELEWHAGQQASGMYLLQLQTPTHQNTQKILLNK